MVEIGKMVSLRNARAKRTDEFDLPDAILDAGIRLRATTTESGYKSPRTQIRLAAEEVLSRLRRLEAASVRAYQEGEKVERRVGEGIGRAIDILSNELDCLWGRYDADTADRPCYHPSIGNRGGGRKKKEASSGE